MIKLLDGHSLTEKNRFQPESMSLTLNQRQSTGRIIIGPEAPEISVGDWLQDIDEPGAGIIWRVKTVDDQRDTSTRTLVIEHIIRTLADCLMFGEITPKIITGSDSATTCTAEQAITYILDRQSDWTLGTCRYSVSNPYNFNGDDLFSALETVSSSLENCWWSYDFSSYPFTLNIMPKTEAVGVELRECRNMQTAKVTVDRTTMFTRFYPTGKNNLKIDSEYVSENENIYGRKDKQETDQSISTKEELTRWANERLRNHCEPSVTVTIQAVDLSRETGETLDNIVLGAVCRVPLKDYGTVIEETITQINYPDKIREPEVATVTLANTQEDVASIINRMIKNSGGGGRAAAKNAQEDHAWFEDTTDHVAMIAEGIAGEGADQDWSRIAELLVDGNGIHQRVTQAQADIVDAYSLIDQTTTAIRIEIGNVQSEMRSFIETTPEMIHAEVGSAVSGFAQSVIEQTATYIRTEVNNAASSISQSVIEQTTEYVETMVSAVASGVAWSVITQTMTNIEQQIARKSKIYVQLTDPNDGVNVLYNGDIWIKAESLKTWNDHSSSTWNSQNAKEWRSKYGDKHYVWRNGAWVLTIDTSTMVENEVTLEQTADGLAIVGRAVDINNQTYNSSLEVTAKAIRSEVSTARSQLYSVIEQTATSIRAKIANEVAGLQSSIEITDSKIGTSVSAAKSALWTTIIQTATGVVTTVMDEVSENYSTITQTSTSIALAVAAGKSAIYSSIILVTSSSIALAVAAGKSAIYSSIILVTSSSIALSVNNAKSSLQSSIKVQSDRIDLVVSGTGSNAQIKPASIVTAINNGASNIIISASHINLDGYVKATQLDANWLSTNIAALSLVTAKKISLNSGGTITFSGNSTALTESNTPDIITGIKVVSSGDGYKLQALRVGNASWTDVPNSSFSRATTLSGAWSGRQFTVTASPQGNIKIGKVYNGVIVLSKAPEYRESGGHHYIKQYVRVYSEDENGDADTTIMDHGVEFNADLAFQAGVDSVPAPTISITTDNVGHSSDPGGTRIWGSTTFISGKYYKFTVNAGGTSKAYKIYIN